MLILIISSKHILVLHSGYSTSRAELHVFDRASKVVPSAPKTKPRRSLTTSYSYHSVFVSMHLSTREN